MEQIIIEIHSGVANVVKKPIGVELIIKDFDTEGSEAGLETNDEGESFVEEIYEADKKV